MFTPHAFLNRVYPIKFLPHEMLHFQPRKGILLGPKDSGEVYPVKSESHFIGA